MPWFSVLILALVFAGIGLGVYSLIKRKLSRKRRQPDFVVNDMSVYWNGANKEAMKDWERLLPAILAKADSEGALRGFWKFGELVKCTKGTNIECKPGVWYNSAGIKVAGEQYPTGIVVVAETRIADSALIHEWIHLAYQKLHRQIDYDHASGNGHWTAEHNDYIAKMNVWINEIQG